MKYFLISFAIWFAIAFLPQLIKALVLEIIWHWKKKHHDRRDDWMYRI